MGWSTRLRESGSVPTFALRGSPRFCMVPAPEAVLSAAHASGYPNDRLRENA
jgi:hypothetical protein